MAIPEVFKDVRVQGALFGFTVGASAVGFGLGYYLGNRKGTVIEIVPPEEAEDDNQLTLSFGDVVQYLKDDVEQTERIISELGYASDEEKEAGIVISIDDYKTLTPDLDEVVVEETTIVEGYQLITTRNIFEGEEDEWDYEIEQNTRTQEDPYVIHFEEYTADEMNCRQETMTYYEGDDVMVDPVDNPIYNYLELMGELKFGHGSQDPNVVYIRNEVLHMEWEILKHSGHYAHEVLGLQAERAAEKDELRHSAVPKFRRE